jgi:hypothetical protein
LFHQHPSATTPVIWLQPARICALAAGMVALGILGYAAFRDAAFTGTAYRPVMALTLSNHARGTYLPAHFPHPHTVQNAPPVQRFEWTTSFASPSSIFSLSQLGTNHTR